MPSEHAPLTCGSGSDMNRLPLHLVLLVVSRENPQIRTPGFCYLVCMRINGYGK